MNVVKCHHCPWHLTNDASVSKLTRDFTRSLESHPWEGLLHRDQQFYETLERLGFVCKKQINLFKPRDRQGNHKLAWREIWAGLVRVHPWVLARPLVQVPTLLLAGMKVVQGPASQGERVPLDTRSGERKPFPSHHLKSPLYQPVISSRTSPSMS